MSGFGSLMQLIAWSNNDVSLPVDSRPRVSFEDRLHFPNCCFKNDLYGCKRVIITWLCACKYSNNIRSKINHDVAQMIAKLIAKQWNCPAWITAYETSVLYAQRQKKEAAKQVAKAKSRLEHLVKHRITYNNNLRSDTAKQLKLAQRSQRQQKRR